MTFIIWWVSYFFSSVSLRENQQGKQTINLHSCQEEGEWGEESKSCLSSKAGESWYSQQRRLASSWMAEGKRALEKEWRKPGVSGKHAEASGQHLKKRWREGKGKHASCRARNLISEGTLFQALEAQDWGLYQGHMIPNRNRDGWPTKESTPKNSRGLVSWGEMPQSAGSQAV